MIYPHLMHISEPDAFFSRFRLARVSLRPEAVLVPRLGSLCITLVTAAQRWLSPGLSNVIRRYELRQIALK